MFRRNISFTENHFAQKNLAELGGIPPLTEKIYQVVFCGFPNGQWVWQFYPNTNCLKGVLEMLGSLVRKRLRPPFHFEKLICNLQKVSPAEELREDWTRIPLSP